MPSKPAPAIAAPPLALLGGLLVLACVIGGLFGMVVHAGNGAAVWLAVASVAGAGVLSLVTFWRMCAMSEPNLGTICLGVSFVRLFGSLAVGLIVFSAMDPARKPFVDTFLVAALAALVFETLVLYRWAGSASRVSVAVSPLTSSSSPTSTPVSGHTP